MEIWINIPSAENYEASNYGNIRRARPGPNTYEGKPVKPVIDKSGYFKVIVVVDGKLRSYRVHNLIAETWIGKRPDNNEIHHINGNRRDNHETNLEYLSGEEHKLRHKTKNLSGRGSSPFSLLEAQ